MKSPKKRKVISTQVGLHSGFHRPFPIVRSGPSFDQLLTDDKPKKVFADEFETNDRKLVDLKLGKQFHKKMGGELYSLDLVESKEMFN